MGYVILAYYGFLRNNSYHLWPHFVIVFSFRGRAFARASGAKDTERTNLREYAQDQD